MAQQLQVNRTAMANSSMLWNLYQEAIANDEMLADPHQATLIEALCPVYDALSAAAQQPRVEEKKKRSAFSRLLSIVGQKEAAPKPELIKGVYIWGGVGRGKTHIVDFFFKHLPIENKERTHFHSFMKSVHDQIRQLGHIEDPLEHVARQIAAKNRVLCLDEMHVNDITDAMLLGGLFKYLFDDGVTLITTSNIPPSGLYKDGLQRKRFLPAIALLEQHTEVVNADGEVDYRMRTLEQADVYQIGTDDLVEKRLDNYFIGLAGNDALIETTAIEINGRKLDTKKHAKGIAWFSFDTLCVSARSTLDYIDLATQYNTVLISGVPVMSTMQDDAARRFVNMIDEFYDRRVNVVISAAAAPQGLYTGKRLSFEFDRTISRLIEMQSRDYLFSKHNEH